MPIKQNGDLRSYIVNLPVGTTHLGVEADGPINTIDVNSLPNGLVIGSNLIQFPANASPEIKSSVSLSLLAAQRVATNDPVVASPDQWFERHNTVLKNLNWIDESGGSVKAEFKDLNVAVHEAIIPFLTAAFGGIVGAGALIITALRQLKEIDAQAPWITLFHKSSRRFNITEYQFSVVEVIGDKVFLKLAAARLDATGNVTQVLFAKVSKERATFNQISKTYSTQTDLLTEMNADLKVKLTTLTKAFIQSLPDDLLLREDGRIKS
jgi:hypothetical protein